MIFVLKRNNVTILFTKIYTYMENAYNEGKVELNSRTHGDVDVDRITFQG